MSARRYDSLALLLAVLAASTSFQRAAAQTSDPAPTTPAVIHACYVPLTGTLYRIKETDLRQACAATSHIEFAWTDGTGALHGTDVAAGDLGGTFGAPTVVRLRGTPVATTAPTAGEVLTFDGTKWGPAAAGTAANPGVVDGPFLATGTLGTGTIPATGLGVRMMWYPTKAAFRAGQVSGPQWDDASVGLFSVAMSFNTTASGDASTAMGLRTTASGSSSTAMGSRTTASGRISTAMGGGTIASGDTSTAMGEETTASGSGSTAMGFRTTASGINATAMGEVTTASAEAATAIGVGTTASGFHSTALGDETIASAASAIAMGTETTASGAFSTAMGAMASTDGRAGSFVYGDGSTFGTRAVIKATAEDQFVVRAQHLWFGTTSSATATTGRFLETSTGAYLSSGGVWTNVSDVNRKHLFESVSSEDILSRVAAMPIKGWSYKAEADSVRHLGPTAQDFYAAFHLGSSNTSIGTIDADGVSLAAIQALEKRTRELEAENAHLKARLDALDAAMQQLQAASHRP